MDKNKTYLRGRICSELELKQAGQTSVLTFSLVTSYKTKEKEHSEFHNCKAWGKTAELIEKYAKKGHALDVEGHNQTESWEKDGKKVYRTYVVVDSVDFLRWYGEKKEGSTYQKKDNGAFSANIEDNFGKSDISISDVPF